MLKITILHNVHFSYTIYCTIIIRICVSHFTSTFNMFILCVQITITLKVHIFQSRYIVHFAPLKMHFVQCNYILSSHFTIPLHSSFGAIKNALRTMSTSYNVQKCTSYNVHFVQCPFLMYFKSFQTVFGEPDYDSPLLSASTTEQKRKASSASTKDRSDKKRVKSVKRASSASKSKTIPQHKQCKRPGCVSRGTSLTHTHAQCFYKADSAKGSSPTTSLLAKKEKTPAHSKPHPSVRSS
jgi:hypothetical protein